MVDIGGKPVLQHIAEWLAAHDVRDIIVNLHHLPSPVIDYFRDGKEFGVRMVYSVERALLGTAGALASALPWLAGTSVIVYGDMLCRFALTDMITQHARSKAHATLACHQTDNPSAAGIVAMKGDRITSIEEKPESPLADYAFAGVLVCEPFFRTLAIGRTDIARDVLPVAASELTLGGYYAGIDAMDIGTPERLEKARREWL
jgi:mannose-1-phosphate guanylyltransferase/phosphomannomutase